jgi:teichuronic acid biosynthesis glycosyltransferase TuaC
MTGSPQPQSPPASGDARHPMRVLMITSEWPTAERPHLVPFIVRQVDFLRRAGIEIEVFSFRGARKPLNYLRAWYRVQRKLWRGAYDVIHAQWGQSAPTALPTRRPLVVTFRGGEGEGIVGDHGTRHGRYTFSGFVLRMVSALVARRADELVVVSSHMREYLPKRQVHVIPSGLDFSRLPLLPSEDARRQLGLPLGKRLVLFVGNPAEARKRYDLAREVVAGLDRELDAELVVAWQVPHDRVPIYMNACDALLFVSMYEGSPNVVKEALACNLPVVSVEVGDVPERLARVPGCRLCRSADPATLTRALEDVLRANRRIEGRATVLDLDEIHLAQKMAQVYRLAARRRGSGVRHGAADHLGKAHTDARL